VVAGKEVFTGREVREACDPSQFNPKVVVARTAMADAGDIDTAVVTARADPDDWRQMTFRQRHRILDAKEGQRLSGGNPVVFELDKKLIKSLPIIDRLRYAAPERIPRDVRRAAAEIGFLKTMDLFFVPTCKRFQGNRSQVQGSGFRVKDKEGLKVPKSSLKMLISHFPK
jgi:hypothetical protein